MFRLFLNQAHLSLSFKLFLCVSLVTFTTPVSHATSSQDKRHKVSQDGSLVIEEGVSDNLIRLTSGLRPLQGELTVRCGKDVNPSAVAPDSEVTEGEFYQPCQLIVESAIKLLDGKMIVGQTSVPLLNAGDRESLQKYTHEYQSHVKRCHQNQVLAAKVCLSEENQSVQDMITYANMIMGTTMATSASGSCSKMSKMMTMATAAMTAYQAACSTARSACLPSCTGAVRALQRLKVLSTKSALNSNLKSNPATAANAQQELERLKLELSKRLDTDLNTSEALSTAGKDKACGSKYGQLLTSALLGITGLVRAKKQADDCEKATASTVAAASVDKCKDPKNANTMDCICEANPRTPGCSNGLAKVGDGTEGISVGGRPTTGTANDILGGADSLGGLGAASTRDPSSTGGSGSSSGGGAGGAMGGASTGGGGGGASSAPKADDKGSEVAFPGFDSGFGGGGGGAWGDWGSGEQGENLEAFLPGGSLDPLADGMAGEDVSAEITSEGGKSNWEKIRERYQDAAPNLLGGGS